MTRPTTATGSLLLLASTAMPIGCKSEPPAVDAGAAPVASVDAAPPKPREPVSDSLAFLAALDKLMEGFVPSVPATDNDANVLRCVTSRALTSDPTLKAAGRKLVARRDKAKKEREKLLVELYALSFRIDYDWRTKQRTIPAVMGCWDDGYETWVDESLCYGTLNKVRVAADPEKFLYSQTTTAPTTPPEVMARIDTSGLTVPARFACRVDDVSTERMTTLVAGKTAVFTQQGAQFWIVDCAAPAGLDVVLRVSGEIANLNAGDVVSLPLANVHRPEGVLLKTAGEHELRWTIDGDATALTVDAAATCPSVTEIVNAAKK